MDELDGVDTPEVTEDEALTDDSEVSVDDETVVDDAPVEDDADASSEGDEDEEDYSNWTLEDAVAKVKELRKESAGYRSDRNRFRDAFEGYDDETVDAYLSAVRAIQSDPAAAHEAFSGLVAALAEAAGITTEQAQELVEESLEEDEDDEILTKSGLEKFLAEKKEAEEAEKAATAARKEVDETIESLGYKQGTVDFNNLLFFATQQEEGSVVDKLNAAHAQVQEHNQAIIDSYVQGEAAKQDLTPPQTDGAAPSQTSGKSEIKSIKDGAKSARAALDAIYGEAEEE